MKKINFSFKVIKIFTKNQIQNKTFLLLDAASMFSRCFIVFLLYGYVFKINGGEINGTTYSTTLWSMFIYFAIMILNIRQIDKIIMNDVKSGNIEMFINKPVNYVLYSFYNVLGKGLYSFLIISIIGSILMVLFVGVPQVNLLIFIPSLIITLILGILLALVLYSIIGLLSFFIEDIRPIHWIVDKTVMILGGSYLPVALFPQFMKIIAFLSPFGAINFATSTVYSSWTTEFIFRIELQVFWIIIFTIILKFIYKKATQKAMVNGG